MSNTRTEVEKLQEERDKALSKIQTFVTEANADFERGRSRMTEAKTLLKHADEVDGTIVKLLNAQGYVPPSERAKKYETLRPVRYTEDSLPYKPDWSHTSFVDVFVGQMAKEYEDRTLDNGETNLNRSRWAPFVLVGDERSHPMHGFNPRTARLFARKLLEAADACELLEIQMGWHPAQEEKP